VFSCDLLEPVVHAHAGEHIGCQRKVFTRVVGRTRPLRDMAKGQPSPRDEWARAEDIRQRYSLQGRRARSLQVRTLVGRMACGQDEQSFGLDRTLTLLSRRI